MRVDIDLDLNDRMVSGPGYKDEVRLLQFKRDTSAELEVRFWSAGVQTELPAGAAGSFGIKKKGEYDGVALVLASSWTKTGTGSATVYTFAPAFNGVALAALLGSGDDDVENDEDNYLGMCEIKWIADGRKHRTQTVDTLIDNDVLKDTDGVPPAAGPIWAPALSLTAPPVNGTASLEVDGADINGGLLFVQQGGFSLVSVIISILPGGPQPLTVDWDDNANLLTIHPETDADDVILSTAQDVLLAAESETPEWLDLGFGGDGSGLVAELDLTYLADDLSGTAAEAMGQQAIVRTTNESGMFRDVWIAVMVTPPRWEPPGNILRAPNETLYRSIVDNAGVPSTEPAYP